MLNQEHVIEVKEGYRWLLFQAFTSAPCRHVPVYHGTLAEIFTPNNGHLGCKCAPQ